jgi:hypothetical protein
MSSSKQGTKRKSDDGGDESKKRQKQFPTGLLLKELQQEHKNAFEPWTAGMEADLLRLHRQGKTVAELATLLKRTPNAISLRLKKFGVNESTPIAPQGTPAEDRLVLDMAFEVATNLGKKYGGSSSSSSDKKDDEEEEEKEEETSDEKMMASRVGWVVTKVRPCTHCSDPQDKYMLMPPDIPEKLNFRCCIGHYADEFPPSPEEMQEPYFSFLRAFADDKNKRCCYTCWYGTDHCIRCVKNKIPSTEDDFAKNPLRLCDACIADDWM